jgi:hypothetical protein
MVRTKRVENFTKSRRREVPLYYVKKCDELSGLCSRGFEFNEKINALIFFLKGMDNVHLPIKLNEIFDVMNQGGILMKSRSLSTKDIYTIGRVCKTCNALVIKLIWQLRKKKLIHQ